MQERGRFLRIVVAGAALTGVLALGVGAPTKADILPEVKSAPAVVRVYNAQPFLQSVGWASFL